MSNFILRSILVLRKLSRSNLVLLMKLPKDFKTQAIFLSIKIRTRRKTSLPKTISRLTLFIFEKFDLKCTLGVSYQVQTLCLLFIRKIEEILARRVIF